jgi:hypothetical protein
VLVLPMANNDDYGVSADDDAATASNSSLADGMLVATTRDSSGKNECCR